MKKIRIDIFDVWFAMGILGMSFAVINKSGIALSYWFGTYITMIVFAFFGKLRRKTLTKDVEVFKKHKKGKLK